MKEMKRYSAFIQMKRITNKMTHIIFRSIPKAKFCILESMNSFNTKHIKIQRHTTDQVLQTFYRHIPTKRSQRLNCSGIDSARNLKTAFHVSSLLFMQIAFMTSWQKTSSQVIGSSRLMKKIGLKVSMILRMHLMIVDWEHLAPSSITRIAQYFEYKYFFFSK